MKNPSAVRNPLAALQRLRVTSKPDLTGPIRFWKASTFILGAALFISIFRNIDLQQKASYNLMTHYNLYYLNWKAGKRPYEAEVALSGMHHDREFRNSLKGITVEEFNSRFPSSFYEIRYPNDESPREKRIFTHSYEHAMKGEAALGWRVEFQNDRLTEFEMYK
jgi:hypothetical protein